MWSELYINDPDILSDVTEIAVKKLGYWIERRLREGRSSPRTFYLYRVLLNMWDTYPQSILRVEEQTSTRVSMFPLPRLARARSRNRPNEK